jgi:hypothetical protein
VTLLQPGAAPMDLEAARTAVQPLFPTDAERRSTQPEGNDDFVVERYRSATLARAIPEDVQASWGGQSGNFLVIYGRSRDTGGRIDRVIIAIGDNVDLARQRGQQ